jgi:hypothetical protein
MSMKNSGQKFSAHWLGVAFAALTSGCIPQHLYQTSAAPVEKLVKLIESDPELGRKLGSDVRVSLWVSTEFERDWLRKKTSGWDRVSLLTKVRGGAGAADRSVSAQNLNEQGWAGTFSLRKVGEVVLENGSYRSKGSEVLLEGTFASDGTPFVSTRPQ